jgi:hypothetical protein
VKEIRADSYQALREKGAGTPGPALNIPGLAVREVNVAEGSVFEGRSLGEDLSSKKLPQKQPD